MDNLAPASRTATCDKNSSGGITRTGCFPVICEDGTPESCEPTFCGAGVPQSCEIGTSLAPSFPACDGPFEQVCLPITPDEWLGCHLDGFVPENAPEYCCERACYQDFSCTEGGSYLAFGQWVADVYGRYEHDEDSPVEPDPIKVAIISRDADPDFDPLAFGAEQRAKLDNRDTLKVVGNLRQVLAARPVWVIVARSPKDIEKNGVCPAPTVPAPRGCANPAQCGQGESCVGGFCECD
jgi:hypothetical protein